MPAKKKSALFSAHFTEKENFFRTLALSGNLKHAYLFFGDEGVGKLTFASLFARFMEEGEFSESKSPLIDLLVLMPDEKGNIGVEAVRSVRSFLSQKPLRSSRRTVIIRGAEVLTPEAQAACLKIVEEPPQSSLIIFTARNPETLFSPLSSRLLKVYFPRMSRSGLADLLVREQGIESARAAEISKRSYGSIGRATLLLKGRKRKASTGFAGAMEEAIVNLREKDLVKNAHLISRLLRMEELMKRYNLNERVQEKAFQYLMKI